MTDTSDDTFGATVSAIVQQADRDPVGALREALIVRRQIDGRLVDLYGRLLALNPSRRQTGRAQAAVRALRRAIPRTDDAIRRLGP